MGMFVNVFPSAVIFTPVLVLLKISMVLVSEPFAAITGAFSDNVSSNPVAKLVSSTLDISP